MLLFVPKSDLEKVAETVAVTAFFWARPCKGVFSGFWSKIKGFDQNLGQNCAKRGAQAGFWFFGRKFREEISGNFFRISEERGGIFGHATRFLAAF